MGKVKLFVEILVETKEIYKHSEWSLDLKDNEEAVAVCQCGREAVFDEEKNYWVHIDGEVHHRSQIIPRLTSVYKRIKKTKEK